MGVDACVYVLCVHALCGCVGVVADVLLRMLTDMQNVKCKAHLCFGCSYKKAFFFFFGCMLKCLIYRDT